MVMMGLSGGREEGTEEEGGTGRLSLKTEGNGERPAAIKIIWTKH